MNQVTLRVGFEVRSLADIPSLKSLEPLTNPGATFFSAIGTPCQSGFQETLPREKRLHMMCRGRDNDVLFMVVHVLVSSSDRRLNLFFFNALLENKSVHGVSHLNHKTFVTETDVY